MYVLIKKQRSGVEWRRNAYKCDALQCYIYYDKADKEQVNKEHLTLIFSLKKTNLSKSSTSNLLSN